VTEALPPYTGTPETLIDAWELAWTRKDPERFAHLCDEQIRYEDPLVAEPLDGLEALSAHARRLWDAFPDARLERLGPRLVDRNYVAAPCKLTGTNRAQLGNLPATNKSVTLPIVFYCELKQGRLLRVRAFFDIYGAAVQLGLLPGRGSFGEKAMLMLRGFGLRGRGGT
jgi:steroid delta-isomerase-like uncharacterized protein